MHDNIVIEKVGQGAAVMFFGIGETATARVINLDNRTQSEHYSSRRVQKKRRSIFGMIFLQGV